MGFFLNLELQRMEERIWKSYSVYGKMTHENGRFILYRMEYISSLYLILGP